MTVPTTKKYICPPLVFIVTPLDDPSDLNLTQGTKTLHLSYGRGYLVTYLLMYDMATLNVSNLDTFRDVSSE